MPQDSRSKLRLLIVFGTRPEALKCFPVARCALADPRIRVDICVTAQHRDMLDQVIELTGLPVHYDLNIMKPGQTLFDTTAKILVEMAGVLDKSRPDYVLVQGDTTTAMTAALSAFYKRIPVGHIEAGLRSGDIYSPWPEELNRKIIGDIAALHFAPTAQARKNLLSEGKPSASVIVTGNTAIDTLVHFSNDIDRNPAHAQSLAGRFPFLDSGKRLILVTGHRRENFDGGMDRVCEALKQLAGRRDTQIVYPVHPNPNVRAPVFGALGQTADIHLLEPLDYLPFLYLLKNSYIVITDSGGVQEEAPALGKPVLVMREKTERPEGVEAGTARLVGTDVERIVSEATQLLDDQTAYEKMSRQHSPYGDGEASRRIIEELLRHA
ncbi:UDP-N-acetylglucosamine 2-epimerase (non-hydrolyzing) [Parvibaculum sp.]|uniref:non-hydrolyzing UDP-N-acetylglucosamine 2-epimerase n=1 Tax=Parvibaculum sp. TaxID=2024848 RepID=UPI001DCA42D2|nr:UDP-N-acetylglucosamine 2-epimerase (non-hydrolyzing) [Parvibaculum sp.]MBX3489202.1 UDP-N-acetylglucosamine 2-epimerase (non-hydrolyzing) [Parvibaculum sp.]